MAAKVQLLAAADRVELISPAGGRLGGFGCRFEAQTGSLDQLFARVLLLQQGDVTVVWVSCDLLGFSTTLDAQFRETIATALSTSSQNILISCTHTHSAPVAMPARGPSGIADEKWLQQGIFARVATCTAALKSRLRVVAEIKTGTQLVSGFGYNRQDAQCPIDEHLYAAALVGEDRKIIATLVNYALHPVVIGEHNLKCSADFPGYVSSTIESKLGGVALFINGSCGDVDPVIYRDQGRDAGNVATIRDIGTTLASAAIASLKPSAQASCDLSIQTCRVAVPLDPPPAMEELVALHASYGQNRTNYQLIWAEELLDAIKQHRVPDSLSAQIAALRIGPVCVLTFPFEIYSQIGLELRKRLAPRHLMIAAYTHGLIGYVATTKAKQQGGYGAGFSHRYFPELLTAIGAGADELLVSHGVSLVRSIDH